VCALEEEALQGNLDDAIVFLFTNNFTVEAGLKKGDYMSCKLFELVLRVRLLQMEYRCQIIMSHILGKQMMAGGMDGVSCRHLKEGMSTGEDTMHFIPFHLLALQRSETMKDWIQWLGNQAEFLEQDDWFERGCAISGGSKDANGFWRSKIQPETFVWSSLLATANVALE
jgi:hypothetical protein